MDEGLGHAATAFYEDVWSGPTGWRYFGWQCSCGAEEYVSRADGGLDECERRALAHSGAVPGGGGEQSGSPGRAVRAGRGGTMGR